MEITDKIKRLTYEQLEVIIKSRRAVPLSLFLSANGKARSCCVMRHKGWMEELLKFTNAAIEASVRAKVNNAVSTATLISAFESMGLGILSKEDLILEEYDLLISPVAAFFPELVVLDQTWTPVPLEQTSRYPPYGGYLPPPEATRGITEVKKTRTFRRKEDNEEVKGDDKFDPDDILAALKPKAKEPERKMTSAEAIEAMMASIKSKGNTFPPPPEPNLIEIPDPTIVNVENKGLNISEQEKVSISNTTVVPRSKLSPEELLRMMQKKNAT